MTISGERTEQFDIFCHVDGSTSDFLSFIDVELIRFFRGALQLSVVELKCLTPSVRYSTFKNAVTLKSGLGVTQGHRN